MKKSDIKSIPEYFDRYINLVADVDISKAFEQSVERLNSLDKNLLEKLNGKKYAADKWSANEIFQHITDWERIFAFRALIFARQEGSQPNSIDQNLLGANTKADGRTIENLVDELKAVRASTQALYASFDNEVLQNTGQNWNSEISVLALGFTILGHQIHHLNILEEKYFPLLQQSNL